MPEDTPPPNITVQDFTEIEYVIDPQDRLLSMSAEWTTFALANQGDGLTPEEVAGRSLWHFIADEATRELYAAVLAHVRSGATTDLVLRCDAPERRRLIEMIVSRRPDGNVEFKTRLLAAKARPVQRLRAKSTPRTGQRLMVCTWCDRVHAGVEEWLEVEAALEHLQLTHETELPQVDPVVCPACFAKIMEALTPSAPAEVS